MTRPEPPRDASTPAEHAATAYDSSDPGPDPTWLRDAAAAPAPYVRDVGLPKVGDTILGGLRVERLIEEGAFGVVVIARQATLARNVAIKFFAPIDRSPPMLALLRIRFEAEKVAVGRAAPHPLIVTVHTHGEYEGVPYLMFEHVPGRPLKALLKEGMPKERRAGLARQLLEAVEHLHQRGVLHLDISPNNLLVTEDGRLKVIDFGLARVHESATLLPYLQAIDADTRAYALKHLVGAGTPEYTAPELSVPNEVDQRADVYSVARVLSALSVLTTRHASVYDQCIAQDPAARLSSIVELRAALAVAGPFDGEFDVRTEPRGEHPTDSIAAHLCRLGVEKYGLFEEAGLFEINPERSCIGRSISVGNFHGVTGVSPDFLVFEAFNDSVNLPSYATEALSTVRVTGRDRWKATLIALSQAPLDADGGITRFLVAGTPYSIKLALRASVGQLEHDIRSGKLGLIEIQGDTTQPTLPCHLHCDGLVLTSDGHMLLAQRDGGVDIDPFQWGATFGEGIEWDLDRSFDGRVDPVRTIKRGMKEELGFDEAWLERRLGKKGLKITFLGVNFQADNLVYFINSLIELPEISVKEALIRARRHAKDKEIRAFSAMVFSPTECAYAVATGRADGKQLVDSGRFAILLASLAKFEEEFCRELASLEPTMCHRRSR